MKITIASVLRGIAVGLITAAFTPVLDYAHSAALLIGLVILTSIKEQ